MRLLMEKKGSSASIQRYKGLGEMNAGRRETTMDPSFRTLRQVTIDSYLKQTEFSMLWEMKYRLEENLLRKTLFTQILMPNYL
jgi:DNA gyrase/topoisomerase IV subunit B